MKIRIHITKQNLIFSAVFDVLALLSYIFAGISLFNLFMFVFLYFLVKNIKITWNERYNGILTLGGIIIGSILTTWLVQYLILEEGLREKLAGEVFVLNIVCCLMIYLLVQACTNHLGLTCCIVHIVLLIFAAINYFVYEFRGNELTFGDLKSAFTGLSVASNYRFTFHAQLMNAILLTLVLIAIAGKLQIRCKKHWLMRLLCLSAAILSFLYVADKTEYTVTETWEQKGSYRNGYLLNFALSIRDSFVEKPELYSQEVIENIEDYYADKQTKSKENKPVIIAIMNESFADLRVMGELKTNTEVMPFIDSLTENTIKGYAISSVYGAKTPNSEWEFLTGNTMAYLPAGSVAYQQYLEEENAYSIVDTLKNEDYTCVAMHPYYATGWSRNTIYPKMGFDEMYFLEDFDQNSLMRKYVSDAAMYDKIIERYEAGDEKENLFLLGVTMQNHGGYTESYENFPADVYTENMNYTDVNQYLSLAHQTDLAVKKLIDYFSGVEKDVVICFFGDHQPSLNTDFYRELNGKGTSGLTLDELQELFTVPFFIWTNYESESKNVERTSLNYLSTMLLREAGISLPPYNQFLADLMEEVPAMNVRGYYSNRAGRYVRYGKGAREEEIWLERYRILQYNGLFDDKNRSSLFFLR